MRTERNQISFISKSEKEGETSIEQEKRQVGHKGNTEDRRQITPLCMKLYTYALCQISQ